MSIILTFLIITVILLLCMVVLIATAAASVMGREAPVRQYEPTCGGCHYIVKDVQAHTCDTCGADFSIVGINMPPATALSTNAATWIAFRQVSGASLAIWTAIVGFIALGTIVAVGETVWPHAAEVTTRIEAHPKSGAYESVTISTLNRSFARGRAQIEDPVVLANEATIELKTAKGRASLHADLLKASMTTTDFTGKSTTATAVPDVTSIATFMKDSGIPDRQANFEAPAIATLLTEPPSPDAEETPAEGELTDSPLEIISNTKTGGWEQPRSLAAIAMPSFGGIWLIGSAILLFYQRARRHALTTRLLNPPDNEVQWEPPTESFDFNDKGPASAAGANPPAQGGPVKDPPKLSDAA